MEETQRKSKDPVLLRKLYELPESGVGGGELTPPILLDPGD